MRWFLEAVYYLLVILLAPQILLRHGQEELRPDSAAARGLGWLPRRTSGRPCIWLHGAAIGEINTLGQLLPRLGERFPDLDLVVSAATTSGYKVAREKFPKNLVVMAPFDLPHSAQNALSRIRPDALVVVEFAGLPHLIAAAQASGIPLAIINGRLSTASEQFCRRLSYWTRGMLAAFDTILVQTPADIEPFVVHGADSSRIRVGGALKYDTAQTNRNSFTTARLAKLAGIRPSDTIFLAGSTRSGEEEIVVRVFARLAQRFPQLKLVVAPRHDHRFEETCRVLDYHQVPFQRRTELESHSGNPSWRALVLNTFGELPAWWGLAHIGFVGNSMTTHGGQNMIEPAALGVATCFGPHTENFQDVVATLLSAEGAVAVADEEALLQFVSRCALDQEYCQALGERGRQAIASQTGALDRTLDYLTDLLRECLPKVYRFPDSAATGTSSTSKAG